MKKLYYAAAAYTVLGLLGGLYYRELTKAQDFTGDTQLAVVHTHFLTLGTIVLLIVMLLERAFTLSGSRWFTPFYWTYNVGLVITVGVMAWHGTVTVLDGPKLGDTTAAMISGIAGLGHILLTVALLCLFVALGKGIKTDDRLKDTVAARR